MRSDMFRSMGRRGARVTRMALAFSCAAALAACGKGLPPGTSSSYLILDSIEAASGAKPNEFAGVLSSDVLTFIKTTIDGQEVRVPTIFADNAQATFRLALKDPGAQTQPNLPTSTNFITITRYRVEYIRSDGRQTQGVDVPYSFDGAMTLTVGDVQVSGGLNLVRIQAKQEAPLSGLAAGGGANVISTIARITFYGRDQAGREVSVTGQIGVNFADWGDPS
jgi:hypothetical protein